eukprot:TRINITY_DN8076_c0_g1_i1.p1 TRINITY_DN8076_c0_g1~~TRINITY_DN8076_c0_g1_i1.p1  ORF type:complete len:152 (-),score=28.79 TRINITY_DN8076_c0_g1_i1:306-761(-)
MGVVSLLLFIVFFFQAEDGIRDAQESRGLGDVYKRQVLNHNGSLLLSSGYDGAVAVSDIRMRSVGCRVFPLGGGRAGALTAISAMGHLMAVAAEDNLCVFDLRKTGWGGYRKEAAWGGICRGLVVDGTEGFPIITSASSDGVIRFFGCNQH